MFSDAALSILPAASRAKLENLLIEKQAARAAFLAASDALQEARQDHGLALGRARERMEMPPGVQVDIHPAAAVVEARRGASAAGQRERAETEARLMAPVEAAKRRLDLASDAYERAASRQDAFGYLENVAAWLSRAAAFGGMRLQHHAPAAPKVRDPAAEIQKLRAELAELDEAWQVAENAPCPADELKARFMAELDAIAARGQPAVNVAARAGSPVNLAAALRMKHEPVALPGGETHFALSGDAGASFFTWLMRDEIAERITSMIDAAAPAKGALTDDERDREFSRISAKRLELERAEEAIICAAEQEGRIIQRRRDADPRAILELREV